MQAVGEIQRSLLPTHVPQIPTLGVAAHYQTSRQAGGDYYDFFPLADGRWGMLIADVSGHGTPAAVVMAVMHALAQVIGQIQAFRRDEAFEMRDPRHQQDFDFAAIGHRWLEAVNAPDLPRRGFVGKIFEVISGNSAVERTQIRRHAHFACFDVFGIQPTR
jgi:hypothetical protein